MRNTRLIWATLVVMSLAACGGGGGGGGNNGNGGGSTGSTGSGGSTTNNSAPVAQAGVRQNVRTGDLVRLDGSASSDADGDRLSFEWAFSSRPSGSNAQLRNADGATPLFTADAAGRYVVTLMVGDGNVFSEANTVTVVATTPPANSVPVADAGENQSVKTSSLVVLDGSRSTDADFNAALSYRWSFLSRPTGSTAQLSKADTEMPSFTADTAGDYVVQLVVNDGSADSSPARVTIVAAAANSAPVADAGVDRGVSVGATVALDGSASSDADGDALGYAWQLVSVPPGSGASLNNADTATPSFVADAGGSYVAQVTVTDTSGASDSDRVVIAAGPTLTLSADLANDGTFETAALPYDETLAQTVVHAPNNGFVLGQFRATAVGGDLTLNLSFGFTPLNDGASSGAYAPAFNGFQALQGDNAGSRQVVLPAGMTVEFTVNVGIPPNSLAMISYRFTVVETGETFEASYMVQSNDN